MIDVNLFNECSKCRANYHYQLDSTRGNSPSHLAEAPLYRDPRSFFTITPSQVCSRWVSATPVSTSVTAWCWTRATTGQPRARCVLGACCACSTCVPRCTWSWPSCSHRCDGSLVTGHRAPRIAANSRSSRRARSRADCVGGSCMCVHWLLVSSMMRCNNAIFE